MNLGIFHLDSYVLYGSVDDDIVLIAEAVECFIKNHMKTFQSQAASFFRTWRLLLTDLGELFTRYMSVEQSPSGGSSLHSCSRCKVRLGL